VVTHQLQVTTYVGKLSAIGHGMQWLCHYDNTTIVVVTAIITGTDNISLRQAVCVL